MKHEANVQKKAKGEHTHKNMEPKDKINYISRV